MSEVIRALNDADLENVSPHLIFCIFVAARFFVGKLVGINLLIQSIISHSLYSACKTTVNRDSAPLKSLGLWTQSLWTAVAFCS